MYEWIGIASLVYLTAIVIMYPNNSKNSRLIKLV